MWTLKFINSYDLYTDSPASVYEVSDNIMDISLDPIAVSSTDYYNQESRNCKVTLLNDGSSFINANIISGFNQVVDPVSWRSALKIWEYGICLYKNNVAVYKGWADLGGAKYDKKSDEIEITFFDIIGLIVLDSDKTLSFSEINYTYLNTAIENALNSSYLLDDFSLPLTFDYTNATGIPLEGNIDLSGYVNGWTKFNNPDETNDFWKFDGFQAGASEEVYSSSGTFNTSKVINVNCYTTINRIILQKHGIGHVIVNSRDYFYESIKQITVTLDKNCGIVNVTVIDETTGEIRDGATQSDINEWLNEKQYYNQFATVGIVNQLSCTDDEGNYIYLENSNDPLEIFFEATIFFESFRLKEGSYKPSVLLKAYLLTNNLYYAVTVNGLYIKNKLIYTDEAGSSLADDRLIEFSMDRVLTSEQDFENLLDPLDYDDKTAVVEAIETYYNENVPSIEYALSIVKYGDVDLNDKIRVNNKDIYINSIKDDNDNFITDLKGW